MSELKNLSPEILLHISQTHRRSPAQSHRGHRAARWRRHRSLHCPLSQGGHRQSRRSAKSREIQEQLAYFRDLVARRETILHSIAEQGKLSDELKARIERCLDKSELEDLYLPYKPKRRTKATIAREKGLEPLAQYLWAQQPAGAAAGRLRRHLCQAEKGVASIEEALEGARHIVAETISEDADLRKALRQLIFDEGVITSRKATDAVDEQEKFKMYYDYREPVKTIPSHRMLAIRRGEAENVLFFLIELEPQRAIATIASAHSPRLRRLDSATRPRH